MSADEYNRILFERMHSERRWENLPADGWSVDDLDETEIHRTMRLAIQSGRLGEPLNSGDLTDIVRGLGLFHEGVLVRAAAVLFGKTERIEFEMPQCLLRLARFRGTDRMGVRDQSPVQRKRLQASCERREIPRRHSAISSSFRAKLQAIIPAFGYTRSPCQCPCATVTIPSVEAQLA